MAVSDFVKGLASQESVVHPLSQNFNVNIKFLLTHDLEIIYALGLSTLRSVDAMENITCM